jgi:hypothetical protein
MRSTRTHVLVNESNYTIAIYDPFSKERALEFANKHKISCYPFQCVPDYLMQCVHGHLPLLPVKYYEEFSSKYDFFSVIPKRSDLLEILASITDFSYIIKD